MKTKILTLLAVFLLFSFVTSPAVRGEGANITNISEAEIKKNKKLYLAIDEDRPTKVEYMLKKGVNVNSIDYVNANGHTPMTYAAWKGKLEVAKMLLSYKADVNLVNKDGWSPLMYAARLCDDSMTAFLMDNGAEVNYTVTKEGKNKGWSPFYLSTKNNCSNTSGALLKNHAKVIKPLLLLIEEDKRDAVYYILNHLPHADVKVGEDPLVTYLTKLGKTGLVRKVSEKGADVNLVNDAGWPPLMFAVREGYLEIARILISNGAVVNFKDIKSRTPMYLAAYHNRPKVGDLLLENYADTDGPLLMANGVKMMDFLFERGADVDSQDKEGFTSTIMASRDGQFDTLLFLIDNRGNVKLKTKTGLTALHFAAERSFDEIAKLLIQYGADVDAKDGSGTTVLISAALNGHTDIGKLLLQNKVDVSAKDNSGTTALMASAANGRTEMVKLLIKNDAHIHEMDNSGATALMSAAVYGFAECVKLLLENGANIDARDASDTTVLMAAAKNDQIEIVNMLVEDGADVTLEDSEGYTASYFARTNEIKKILLAASKKSEGRAARDEALPVDLRRDKYMRMIKTHMENKKYAAALPFFDKLYALDIVIMDDSLTFYYAEALYRTGKLEQAIEKLYEYMKIAGKDGEFYLKAIDLSNEIEEKL